MQTQSRNWTIGTNLGGVTSIVTFVLCTLFYFSSKWNFGISLVAALMVCVTPAAAIWNEELTAADWRSIKAWSFWGFRSVAVAVGVMLFYSAPSRSVFYLTTALFVLLYVLGERAMRHKRQQVLAQTA